MKLLFRLDGVKEKGARNVVAARLVSVKGSPVHPLCSAAFEGAVRAVWVARARSSQTPLPLGCLERAAKLDVLAEESKTDLVRLGVVARIIDSPSLRTTGHVKVSERGGKYRRPTRL